MMEAVMQNSVCVRARAHTGEGEPCASVNEKSICFPCWRWMLSAEQGLLALAFAVSNGQ